jgi:hypothetical protein
MFFLYYDKGSCNDGDHHNEIEEFDTLAEAMTRAAEVCPLAVAGDKYPMESVFIFEGREVYRA